MEQGFEKRRVLRRSSAQFYVTAEEHMKNEMKHERHLTETSRLTSSWANLRLTGTDKAEYSDCGFSSPGSSGSSPLGHRPNSFSGPLMISVTCSSSGCVSTTSVCEPKPSVAISTTFSRSSSCYPSPVASPVSSRIQCYSPNIGLPSAFAVKKRTASVSSGSSASPLILAGCRGKKRAYACLQNTDMTSSTEASRESSPEPSGTFYRSGKIPKPSEAPILGVPHFGSPRDSSRCTPPVSTPTSPAPSTLSSMRMPHTSPSACSLPSLTHSTSSTAQSISPRPPIFPIHSPDFSQSELKPYSPSSLSCPDSVVIFHQANVQKCPEHSNESGEK